MNVKRNAVVLGIALLAGFFSTAQSGEFFTDQGSIWAGGTISYGIEYDRNGPAPVNMINLSPLIRFFPCKYLVLSPAFSWGTDFETYTDAGSTYSYSEGTFVIGPEVGFAYGNNIHVVPYVISGIKYQHSYSSETYSGAGMPSQTTNSGADGYRIPLYTGIMIPIVDGLGIQVETGFAYSHLRNYAGTNSINGEPNQDFSVFSISVGVCGIGKKTAISILTGIL